MNQLYFSAKRLAKPALFHQYSLVLLLLSCPSSAKLNGCCCCFSQPANSQCFAKKHPREKHGQEANGCWLERGQPAAAISKKKTSAAAAVRLPG